MWRLVVLFTVFPAVELFLLLQLGAWMGPTSTFLFILLTGVFGAWMAKREGLGVLRALQGELQRGLPPADRLMEGGLVLVGGLLLVTPGVITDLVGLLLIVPPTRRFLAPRVLKFLSARLEIAPVGFAADPDPGPTPRRQRPVGRTAHPFANPFDDLS